MATRNISKRSSIFFLCSQITFCHALAFAQPAHRLSPLKPPPPVSHTIPKTQNTSGESREGNHINVKELVTELPAPSLTSPALGLVFKSLRRFCVAGCRERTGAAEDSQIRPLRHTDVCRKIQRQRKTDTGKHTHKHGDK